MSRRSSNERYHDRVAPRYEEQHEGDSYLAFCRELTWRHLKRFLPIQARANVLDAGCGPGHFGVKLAKSGYATDFLDLSEGMLEQARKNYAEAGLTAECRFVRASLDDRDLPAMLGEARYSLVIALGDVLSFVPNVALALRNVKRLLVDGGVFLASVDQRYAGLEHMLERGDVAALERFMKDGRSEWLAKDKDERFPTKMFKAAEIERLASDAGLSVVSMIGRPVLPMHKNRSLLDDGETKRRLLALEERIGSERELLGRASHIEFAARSSRAAPVT